MSEPREHALPGTQVQHAELDNAPAAERSAAAKAALYQAVCDTIAGWQKATPKQEDDPFITLKTDIVTDESVKEEDLQEALRITLLNLKYKLPVFVSTEPHPDGRTTVHLVMGDNATAEEFKELQTRMAESVVAVEAGTMTEDDIAHFVAAAAQLARGWQRAQVNTDDKGNPYIVAQMKYQDGSAYDPANLRVFVSTLAEMMVEELQLPFNVTLGVVAAGPKAMRLAAYFEPTEIPPHGNRDLVFEDSAYTLSAEQQIPLFKKAIKELPEKIAQKLQREMRWDRLLEKDVPSDMQERQRMYACADLLLSALLQGDPDEIPTQSEDFNGDNMPVVHIKNPRLVEPYLEHAIDILNELISAVIEDPYEDELSHDGEHSFHIGFEVEEDEDAVKDEKPQHRSNVIPDEKGNSPDHAPGERLTLAFPHAETTDEVLDALEDHIDELQAALKQYCFGSHAERLALQRGDIAHVRTI